MIVTLLLFTVLSLVPGTESTWTDGKWIWDGNPFCAEQGLFPSATTGVDTEGNPIDPRTVGACLNLRQAVAAVAPTPPMQLEVR